LLGYHAEFIAWFATREFQSSYLDPTKWLSVGLCFSSSGGGGHCATGSFVIGFLLVVMLSFELVAKLEVVILSTVDKLGANGQSWRGGQGFGNHPGLWPSSLTKSKIIFAHSRREQGEIWGDKLMHTSRNAVLENVRRYRAIASLYRQTATFRPVQRCSLLGQAEEWEYRALAELEAYFAACTLDYDKQMLVATMVAA
jgi:hypothetical protein